MFKSANTKHRHWTWSCDSSIHLTSS